MFAAATSWLERSAQSINTLNVFPVPDGDTGTNMLLTMRAAVEEATRCPDEGVCAVAQAMARGSLMGARGNSGVILSQIFRGLAKGLDGKKSFSGKDLAAALIESSTFAYKGMSKPVEGTILTVMREAAEAARVKSASPNGSVVTVMEAVVDEAKASVARTPMLLPVLRQAGVVDAGGQGLYVVFEGIFRYLRGDRDDTAGGLAEAAPTASLGFTQDGRYGYCTEFLLSGRGLDLDAIREKLSAVGDSLLVVGDEGTVKVHVHTFDPGAALTYATSLGVLRHVKVDNMDDQHRDFILARPQPASISTVAVVSGEGLTDAFYSIGATIIVPGGKTMNPSVSDLLKAVDSAPSEEVIILPNHPNILMAAGQVPALTKKRVEIVRSESIPHGIAALLAFSQEVSLEENAAAMDKALSTVRSGEVTRAVRSMDLDGLSIKKGQAIAFLDGRLVVSARSVPRAVINLVDKMGVEQGGLVTIYYGADTDSGEAQQIANSLRQKYAAQEVEVVAGGQPHYHYIISVE